MSSATNSKKSQSVSTDLALKLPPALFRVRLCLATKVSAVMNPDDSPSTGNDMWHEGAVNAIPKKAK